MSRTANPYPGSPLNDVSAAERYPEILQALEWYIGAGLPDAAYWLASSLVRYGLRLARSMRTTGTGGH
jgi:hypothetical protein